MGRQEINLLNYDIEHRTAQRWDLAVGTGVVGLTCLIMVFIWTIAANELKSQKAELLKLETSLQELSSGNPDLHLEKLVEQVEKKRKVIAYIQNNKPIWSICLAEADRSIPAGVHLNSIAASQNSLILKGRAESFADFIKLNELLRQSRHFSEITIKSAGEVEGRMEFEIWMRVHYGHR